MTPLRDAIAKNSFAVFGRAGMDLFPDPPGTRTREAAQMSCDLGGSSANIAAGLCKFGARAALITSVSDDAVGWFCLTRLHHYGVETTYVRRISGEYRTSLAVYESRVEDHQSVIYRNGAADFQVTREDVDAVPLADFGAFITAGTVFAADPSRDAAFHAFDKAHAAGLPVLFDIDYRPYSWPSAEVAADVLSRAGDASDMIVGNDEEFGFMAGDMAKGLQKAQDLASEADRLIVYKMGEKGAITFYRGQEIKTGIYEVTALKPTGAGDSFMAGLLSGLASGLDLRDAVLRGSACAAIVVARPGCAPAMPTEDQLKAFLSDHPGPSAA
ncbi:5-dehydro-2-deoxygluconokinase [Tropicimonas sp. S265A]|uniref:5-dehydro-2-deoxygluconokinase n=1 Tax=Tropicimonas sp. S265A TaxID=3415134 RepID=UPI003C7BAE34